MKRGKRFSVVILTFVLVILMPIVAGAADKTYTLKYATTGPADPVTYTPYSVGFVFKTLVEAQSQGKVKVELFPGGQLGNQRETIEGVMMGTVEIASTNIAALSGFFPPADIFSIPYLFSSDNEAIAVLDGPFGIKFIEEMAKKLELRVVGGISLLGFRHLTNSVRPIKTPGDVKGLKFRTMDTPIFIEMFKAMGAHATPISITEVYLALQLGTVDGQENPASVTRSYKFHEVQKYMTLDGHTMGMQVAVMNESYLKSLPDEIRKTILRCMRDAVVNVRGVTKLSEQIDIDAMRNEGLQIYAPTEDELEQFRKITQQPCIELLKANISEDWINGVLGAVEEAKEKVEAEYKKFVF
ncbi:TRAP transporter substrate-binding protein DctP [Acetomicrobium sp. S15 = DSM 107314]|uniref:TRAP transporter substrate-binding protein DctP n=1 Tax=Acetomicrobium sp. S15 = DSM 107314 TaxID=2529858 RepID=UPI0018E118B2|nr:TRAP transporter substrate-binding protein DctP [Acetomicrobium sp. S15 = DSM 107314]